MLQTHDLAIAYGGMRVVDSVSLEVRAGSITAIVGPNGAGKTSIVNTVMGLHRADSGQVRFGETVLDDLPTYQRILLGMTLVPEARRLFPLLTVETNLDLGAFTPRTRSQRAQLRRMVYDLFPRLAERRNQRAGSLSGGEQQMLALGRALMSEPDLLILDEPTLGLAPVIVQSLFETIYKLNQQGTTILLVEQNTAQALRLADYAYVLESGRIVHEGTGAELLTDDYVRKAYLGELA